MWLLSPVLTRGSITAPSVISLQFMKHRVDLHYSLALPMPFNVCLSFKYLVLTSRCTASDSSYKQVPLLQNGLCSLSLPAIIMRLLILPVYCLL